MPKVVIALVAGDRRGHVLHVICDLTIAADNAIFGQTKVGSFDGGLVPAISPGLSVKKRRGNLVPLAVHCSAGAKWVWLIVSCPWMSWNRKVFSGRTKF